MGISKPSRFVVSAVALLLFTALSCYMPQLAFADSALTGDAPLSTEGQSAEGVSEGASDGASNGQTAVIPGDVSGSQSGTSENANTDAGQTGAAEAGDRNSGQGTGAQGDGQGANRDSSAQGAGQGAGQNADGANSAPASGEASEASDEPVVSPGQIVLSDGTVISANQVYSVQTVTKATTDASLTGLSVTTHVQKVGWQDPVGAGVISGTTGRALRLEGIRISLTGNTGIAGHINYSTHVQKIGWQQAAYDGGLAGTTGRALRLEGIKIWLSGDISKHFDIYYRTHVQSIGWQGWVRNGAVAGTTGRSLRLEAIQISLSAKTEEAAGKGSDAVGARYDAHVQSYGWQTWVGDGAIAGTSGKSKRVEALTVSLSTGPYKGGLSMQAHVQSYGWMGAVGNGGTIGTTGKAKRVEAIRIGLTGEIADYYDIYYCVHVQKYGWLDWASNGAMAGSTGYSLRVEAARIVLREKGKAAPGPTQYPTVDAKKAQLDGIDIASHQAGINIANVSADFIIVKATENNDYTNPYFKQWADQALAYGKLLGIYHFAHEGSSAAAQANYFYNAVKPYVGKAVLFLDWENTDKSKVMSKGPSWAKAWLDRVYSLTGVKPLIYMSKSVTRSYNWSSVASTYKLWVAQYADNNTTGYQTKPWTDSYGYGAWKAPTVFQYSSHGRLSGYSGNLDLDKFYGTIADWRLLAKKS